jgi:imidazoleglycerol phosphate synthase glutamine amidotransferase subunit HisH
VRSVTADDLQSAIDRLAAAEGELAAVAERMRYVKLRQITLTGWGKFERAMDLLQEFSAHAEFAVKTSKTRD